MSADSAMHDDLPPPVSGTRAILYVAGGILLLLAASVGVLIAVFSWQVPNEEPQAPRVFPGPHALEDETTELKNLRAEHEKQLESYAWADRNKQKVAIPIERAMQIIAKRGKDAYGPIEQQGTPGQSSVGQGSQGRSSSAQPQGQAPVEQAQTQGAPARPQGQGDRHPTDQGSKP